MQPHVQEDALSRNSMYYIACGYLKKILIGMFSWKKLYTQESKDHVQQNGKRNGYALKGCVARNIVMVKHELVKQLLKAGREYDAGHCLL